MAPRISTRCRRTCSAGSTTAPRPPSPTSSRAAVTRSMPLETPGTNSKALRIKTALGDWLYVEYRRPVGFDSYISTNANLMNGVLVHYFDGGPNGVYLLDMTPATSSWSDPALPVGTTFQDAAGKVSITPTGLNAANAIVSVTVARRLLRPAGADRDDHSGTAAGPAGSDRDVHGIRCRTMAPAAAPRSLPFRRQCRRAGRPGWARRPSRSPRGRRGRRRFRSRRAPRPARGPMACRFPRPSPGSSARPGRPTP